MRLNSVRTRLKMKDLEAQTGVSREAIHFYLREGLLPEPERPKHNVAHYSEEHVLRIRTIKRLQHDRSLSLEAIKPILKNFDYDALPEGNNLAQFEVAVQARVNEDLPGRDQKLSNVANSTGLSVEFLQELHELGVIKIKHTGHAAALDFRDVGILEHWAALLRLGFGGQPGYDAQYLKRFADAIRIISEFEVDNFLAVFSELSSDDAANLAAEGIGLTNEILTRLRTQTLMRTLHNRVGATAESADSA